MTDSRHGLTHDCEYAQRTGEHERAARMRRMDAALVSLTDNSFRLGIRRELTGEWTATAVSEPAGDLDEVRATETGPELVGVVERLAARVESWVFALVCGRERPL